MIWNKLGKIYKVNQEYEWMYSHTESPIAVRLEDSIYRILFSTRNKNSVSSVSYIDIDIDKPKKILKVSNKPILVPGKIGLFDDSGVVISSIVEFKEYIYIYYVGWNLGISVPWRNSIGLAIYNKINDAAEKYSIAPILDRNEIDPYGVSHISVLKDGDIFKMWYSSNLLWDKNGLNGKYTMKHVIKYAESKDGIRWNRTGIVCIKSQEESEYIFTRPYVIKDKNIYKMWYSYRGSKYMIGYAESIDGIRWIRKDELAGIVPSEDRFEWDAEMILYPSIFKNCNNTYMLYCGNEHGREGFGIAILNEN